MARASLASRTSLRCSAASAVVLWAGSALAQQPPAPPVYAPGGAPPAPTAEAPAQDAPGAPIAPPGPAITPPGGPGPYGPQVRYGPPPPPPTYVIHRRADNGMFAGGLLLLAGTSALALGGIVGMVSSVGRIQVFCTHPGSASYPCEERTDAALLGGSTVALAGGIAGVAVSIYLVARGGKTVPTPFNPAVDRLSFTPTGFSLAF